jgi:hypothetical protein
VTKRDDRDDLSLPVNSINYPIITDSHFQKAGELSAQSLGFCLFKVLCQPFEPVEDALLNAPTEPPQ